MAKNQVKRTAGKSGARAAGKSAKSNSKSASKGKSPAKAVGGKKLPAKKVIKKKPVTEKEREIRAANLLANSEKKKKVSGKRPKKTSTPSQTSGLLDAVVEGMREKKARNIMILDLNEIENRVTDYFVICDADSNTHVNSIADSVVETVEKLAKEKAYHSEGHQNGEWILIDYINVVAHVFLREMRDHYNIEALWGDAAVTLIND